MVAAPRGAGTTYDLVLLGNDAADTGDFQVGIRLSYLLGRPVVTGVSTLEVDGGDGPAGPGTGRAPRSTRCRCPRCVTVMEGGVEPRYPSIPGRMKAKKITIEQVARPPSRRGSGRVRLTLPPPPPRRSRCWARARTPRGPWSTCSRSWGCAMNARARGDRATRAARGLPRDADLRRAGSAAPCAALSSAAATADGSPTARRVRRHDVHRRGRRRLRRLRGAAWAAAVAAVVATTRRRRASPPARRGARRCWRTSPPAGRRDGSERGRGRRRRPAGGLPPGSRRRGHRGDAAATQPGGPHRRRARLRARARRGRDDAARVPVDVDVPRRTCGPGWCAPSRGAGEAGTPEVGAGRGRCRSRGG